METDKSSLVWQHHKVHTNPPRTAERALGRKRRPVGREGEAQGRQAKGRRKRGGELRARPRRGALRPRPETLPASEDVLEENVLVFKITCKANNKYILRG